MTGYFESLFLCLITGPRGTNLFCANVRKTFLVIAIIDDSYMSSKEHTATIGKFASGTFYAISRFYIYLN